MIRAKIYISKYDWLVHCFFAVDKYYTKSILNVLNEIGCPDGIYYSASENLRKGKLDTGFTYSNGKKRASLLVVGLASCPEEYDNSIAHELRHLEDGIAKASGMSLSGEDVAYLAGDIRYAIHDITSALTCNCRHCRTRIRELTKTDRIVKI